jgi:hypothetical protein
MKTIFKTMLKSIFIVIMTFAVFILLKNTIAQVGGMPQSFKDAYQESYFIRSGTFYPAIILLMTVILIHMLLNYIYLQKHIQCMTQVKGTLYGLAFGILWFFGFLELVVTYHSDFFRHVTSGVRDLISLTVFGILAGLCFTTKAVDSDRKGESLGVMLYTSVLFALFHGIQYFFTFKAIEQHIDDIFTVVWLLSTGAWIGIMYYYLSPKIENRVLKTIFFSVNTFGINWLLYTSFYHLFLDMPVYDLLIRCIFDMSGIWLGLLLYEFTKTTFTKLRIGG